MSVARLESFDADSLLRAVEQLQRQSVEGILLNAGQEEITRRLGSLPVNVPVVAVEDTIEAVVPVVAVDQFAGGFAATRLLLELGHRSVSHLAGPQDWLAARRRIDGYRASTSEDHPGAGGSREHRRG